MKVANACQAVLSTLLLLVWSSTYATVSDLLPGEDSVMLSDEGSGPDDEDLTDLFSAITGPSDVTFRCYKCTGISEQSGCNMTSFHRTPMDYVTECSGHCLNISTAGSVVFDCTDDVPAKADKCFQKDGMQMCICNFELCNGSPSPPIKDDDGELPASQKKAATTSHRDVNVTFPELSEQHQNNVNNTYINAADRASAGIERISNYLYLLTEFLWMFTFLQGNYLL